MAGSLVPAGKLEASVDFIPFSVGRVVRDRSRNDLLLALATVLVAFLPVVVSLGEHFVKASRSPEKPSEGENGKT